MSDSWVPRMVVFQCQYALYSPTELEWMESQLPPHVKLIRVPCTGRISPLFVLNAIQGGVDGVLVNGCVPEKCHYKEGNLGAHRQLDEFRRFMGYLGMDEERIRFAWFDVSERGRIHQELAELEETIREVGRAERFVTRSPARLQGERV